LEITHRIGAVLAFFQCFQSPASARAKTPHKHYTFVIHQSAPDRSRPIQWNFAIVLHVRLSDFLAAGVAVHRPARRNLERPKMTSKTALIFATTAAIALGGFDMRPAAAAPEGGPAIAKQNAGADELSSQRRRRGRGGVAPLVAFGAIIGTIGAIAAANSRREVYYGGGPYYYAEPQYVPAPQYHVAPQPYVQHHYAPRHYGHHAPGPRHYGHQGHGPRQYPLGSFQGGPRGGGPGSGVVSESGGRL
jgi:hypothetical protein